VNYQFGFDVTSSWGYQLLLRSTAWLLVLGIAVIVTLNTMVIVEPHQMGIKLARGQMVGEPLGSGILWKAPWPLETAELHDVTTIRQIHLTPHRQIRGGGPDGKDPWTGTDGVQLWTDDLSKRFDKSPHPFIVGGYQVADVTPEMEVEVEEEIAASGPAEPEDQDARRLATSIALVDAEVILQYRIKDQQGLMQYLDIASDTLPRDRRLHINEEVLRQVALREVSRYLADLSLSEVLSTSRLTLASDLRDRIQLALDRNQMGLEAVAVDVTLLRPAGVVAAHFEELSVANQNRLKAIKDAEQQVVAGYAAIVGDPQRVEPILEGIDHWEQLQETLGPDTTETLEAREQAEQMLLEAGGRVAQLIAEAERDRWVRLIDAMAQAKHLEGQLKPYRAAPRLYRQREIMRVYAGMLPGLYKYVLGIDPRRVDFEIELRELTGLFNLQDAIKDEEGESSQ
jgi:regulator of protease activity HflC (stomatin/prohibitin superfamily)